MALWVLGAALGCSQATAPAPRDGGALDASAAEPLAPAAPAPPAPPALSPCPDGWREVADYCEPWPESGRATCADAAEAHFPGGAACETVGAPCASDGWPADLPTDHRLLYVAPSGSPTGDGTIAAPFQSIAAAVAVARAGTVIAIGSGSYDEEVRLPAGVTLWGACAGDTELVSTVPSNDAGVITVIGADAVVRDLRIGGARPGIYLAGAAASVHLRGVAVIAASYAGVFVRDGAQLTADGLVVRDTAERAIGGEYGVGVAVFAGARAHLQRVVIAGNREIGLWAKDVGSDLAAERLSLEGTMASRLNGRWGHGVDLADGAHMTLAAAVIEGNDSGALLVGGGDTQLIMRDVVVRDTRPQPASGRLGRGLSVADGARVEVERALYANNREAGIVARGVGTQLVLNDVVVRGTEGADGDLLDGMGLALEDGAEAEVHRAVFDSNQTAGVVVREGTRLTATDLVITGTRARSFDGTAGEGLYVEGEIDLERAMVADNHEAGVLLLGGLADASLTDLTVRDTSATTGTGEHGEGLFVGAGATAAVRRASLERNRGSSVVVIDPGSSLVLVDAQLRDTRATGFADLDGYFGRGISVQSAARVTGERWLVDGNLEVGVFVSGSDTSLVLHDAVVERTLPRACAESWCEGFGSGIGVGVYGGAHSELRRFRIAHHSLCGLQLAEGGALDLHQGVVADNPIGANLQTEGFDRSRLADEVLFLRNERNLDASGLGIPEPQSGI